jgi:putative membrane protein
MADENDQRTGLSVDRTMLAHERTLMAWTRTATSLISFGFTIYTFFQNFGIQQEPHRLLGAANYALLMIGTGLICLVLATLRHWRDIRTMEAASGAKPRLLAPLLAGLVSCLGIFGLLAVISRA